MIESVLQDDATITITRNGHSTSINQSHLVFPEGAGQRIDFTCSGSRLALFPQPVFGSSSTGARCPSLLPASRQQKESGRMLAEGTPAPDFTLPDQDANPVTLSDLRGHWVLLWWYPMAGTPG